MIAELDLTPVQRETCLKYYGEELRLEDIARDEGCSVNAISKRLKLARKKYPTLDRRYNCRKFNPFD